MPCWSKAFTGILDGTSTHCPEVKCLLDVKLASMGDKAVARALSASTAATAGAWSLILFARFVGFRFVFVDIGFNIEFRGGLMYIVRHAHVVVLYGSLDCVRRAF